jgi:uncharacterized membrane protein YedE/YeeE
MRTWLTAFGTGTLFGLGLAWSGMTNPARVLAFLDVTGDFDPTLALVMGGALAVTFPAFAWILKRPRPLLEPAFRLPTATRIDAPLVGGAALFGLGWGLAGLCPGPALKPGAAAAGRGVPVPRPGVPWPAGRSRGGEACPVVRRRRHGSRA